MCLCDFFHRDVQLLGYGHNIREIQDDKKFERA